MMQPGCGLGNATFLYYPGQSTLGEIICKSGKRVGLMWRQAWGVSALRAAEVAGGNRAGMGGGATENNAESAVIRLSMQ